MGIKYRWLPAIVFLFLALLFPFVVREQLLLLGIGALLSAYWAVCWNLASGYANLFSLGHTIFIAIGAYVSTVLFQKLGVTPWLGMLAGAAAASLVGGLLAWISFRYRVKGIYFALITLGGAEVLRVVAEHWPLLGGASGLYLPLANSPAQMLFMDRWPYYVVVVALLGFGLVVVHLVENSRFGYNLIALREDEEAAEASGIDTVRNKVLVMALSAAMTALGGSFYAQFYLYVGPDVLFSFEHVIVMMLGTMVGGPGSVWGPVAGSLVFAGVGEAVRSFPFGNDRQAAALGRMIYGLILVFVVLYLPRGLMSLRFRSKPKQTIPDATTNHTDDKIEVVGR